MTEVRVKDKLFLAVVVPVAALAAYGYFWRAETGRRVASLAARSASLVQAEDFDFERQRAERELKAAEAELAAERAVPVPAQKVVTSADMVQAERERQVLAVFREAGLGVLGSDVVEGGAGAAVLRATGLRPAPICRRYLLDGRYPQVRKALETFAECKMAVVVEKMEMGEVGRGRWKLEVSL